MEFLELLLKNFTDENTASALSSLLKTVSENGFDLNKIMKTADISALLPLLGGLFSGGNAAEKPKAEEANPLAPVSSVADRDIVFALNRYLAAAR